MPRYAAFLRAINVGGHTVKMDALRGIFESLGLNGVATFIVSGNVVFEAPEDDAPTLERRISLGLLEALGYEVACFVRSMEELAEIAAHQPFTAAELEGAVSVNVAFTAAAVSAEEERRLREHRTDIDDFRVRGREVYWLCRRRQSESTFSNAALEKTLGRPSTLRGVSTVTKIRARFAGGGGRGSSQPV